MQYIIVYEVIKMTEKEQQTIDAIIHNLNKLSDDMKEFRSEVKSNFNDLNKRLDKF
jgi:hypothetical protein